MAKNEELVDLRVTGNLEVNSGYCIPVTESHDCPFLSDYTCCCQINDMECSGWYTKDCKLNEFDQVIVYKVKT
jgi:hypothetical protein